MDRETSLYCFPEKARKITFGKYKGRYIIELIATHIGYIMWCLNNIKFFHLTEEEQILYDIFAISIIRDNLRMTFPIEDLKDHIKDKKSLEELNSPIVNKGTNAYINLSRCSNIVRDIYSKYKDIIKEGDEIEKGKYLAISFADTVKFLNHEVEKLEEFYPVDDNTEFDFDFFKDY